MGGVKVHIRHTVVQASGRGRRVAAANTGPAIRSAAAPPIQAAETLRSGPDARRATAGALLRMYWLVVGNLVVYVAWMIIVFTSSPLPSAPDVVVWLTVVSMLIARRVEILRYSGRTTHGEPATLEDWRRYAAVLVGATVVGSLIAHQLGGSLLR